jgi:hypothetical protein
MGVQLPDMQVRGPHGAGAAGAEDDGIVLDEPTGGVALRRARCRLSQDGRPQTDVAWAKHAAAGIGVLPTGDEVRRVGQRGDQ